MRSRGLTGTHIAALLLAAAVLAWLIGAPDPVGFWFLKGLAHDMFAAH